jgi:hypothetical protein
MIEREKTCILIDVATPDISKVDTKETVKLSKFKDLEIDANRMWKLRAKIFPVIIEALEIIKKRLVKDIQLLPIQPSAVELQTFIIMSTAHLKLKVLGEIALISC